MSLLTLLENVCQVQPDFTSLERIFQIDQFGFGGKFPFERVSRFLPAQKLIHPYRSGNGSAQFLTTKPKNKISRPDRLNHWEYPQYCQFEHNSPYLLVKIFSSAPICKWRKPQVLLFLSQQRRGIGWANFFSWFHILVVQLN